MIKVTAYTNPENHRYQLIARLGRHYDGRRVEGRAKVPG